ncbi:MULTISPECIES: class I SAM-dependent methyltransferase [unclassified Pseudomonas]|uniref:class I SAM-dependent methyltransferase n=1 Tax=unclassified Pseudomonas TaxID=196821 RepID=UPI002AC9232E|nr:MULTISPECIES: class I SAM-dependent methyltransferase [unclassified Pseudomonas]MEB0040636.1 class I SAM-dependent methyltransferase [Pseudomonas sp. MH10]MEB0123147.1 class I SAM-dependent methyltransferase [Pseudomonas sp. CCI1.2]WPX64804.1 class I SAM-dependent methyltransferase [Pseudomonas sp. MH10]
MSVADSYFEQLFDGNDDPWAFKQRWYERRKRALTLAALPREHYSAIFEPGCANGELSAALATRCDHLLICDTSLTAVGLAKQRLQGVEHAQVLHARLPYDWPEETFELIVFSELGYYLDPLDLDQWIDRALTSLAPDGQLLACHWCLPIEGCPQTAQQVHQRLQERLPMHRLFAHQEKDFLLDVWSRDPISVAEKEGLR